MIDYSFLRLKDNLSDALNMGDSPTVTHYFLNPIQLIPDKTYCQITNVEGGISLDSDCEVFVVDCNDNIKADITDNVFIEEFTDANGNNQCKIELVNLGVDFYRNTVLLKLDMLSSNAVWYSVPLNITAYQSHLTTYFKYKNYDDFLGIGYTNANAWQSISLSLYFDIPLDETETEDYFQISRNNTISARALIKLFEQYRIEQINRFTFDRLNALLKHELIYLDDIRVTNKPTVSSSEREGDSNFFETDLVVAKNYNDSSPYTFQIFEGLVLSNFTPQGVYLTGTTFNAISFEGNVNLTLNEGTISIFNSSGVLQDTFEQSQMTVSGNTLTITTSLSYTNDTYYVNVSNGLVSGLGVPNNSITDNTTWTFTFRDADFLNTDFNNDDFFTN